MSPVRASARRTRAVAGDGDVMVRGAGVAQAPLRAGELAQHVTQPRYRVRP